MHSFGCHFPCILKLALSPALQCLVLSWNSVCLYQSAVNSVVLSKNVRTVGLLQWRYIAEGKVVSFFVLSWRWPCGNVMLFVWRHIRPLRCACAPFVKRWWMQYVATLGSLLACICLYSYDSREVSGETVCWCTVIHMFCWLWRT